MTVTPDEYDEAAATLHRVFDAFFDVTLADIVEAVAQAGPELVADLRESILAIAREAFDGVVERQRVRHADRSG